MTGTGELRVRVAAKSRETAGIALFELVALDGETLPSFEAGAHIDVHTPGGAVRQYSLCNAPSEAHHYLIGVLRELHSRGGSLAMHEQLSVGDTVVVSRPRNHFRLERTATHSVLLAGGIGVTPLLSMAHELNASSSFEMHYCTRSESVTAFRSRIADSSFNDRVHYHFDDGAPEQRFDAAAQLASPVAGTHLYVCGPRGFMDWVLTSARNAGWSEEQLHYEFFSAELNTDEGEEFEVELATSGLVVTIPRNKSVADALAERGVVIEMSCEQGVCGTCLTRVLAGVPDHKDLYLTHQEQEANDQILPCCSRSKSRRLVLDL